MKKLVVLMICCISSLLYAQENSEEMRNKALICAACHGDKGISLNPQWPNLAGQNKQYLLKQLKEIKEGTLRNVPAMSALMNSLNLQEMDDLAAYYAKMRVLENSIIKKDLPRGEKLYRSGDRQQRITACIACHGPTGRGNTQAGFPMLAGQHALYTVLQLQAFKENKRTNDLNHIMQDITNRMNTEDMEAVAQYIENLH